MRAIAKLTYLLLLLFVPMCQYAQVLEDFSDGDFLIDPTWSGDVVDFEVDTEFRLHLVGPEESDESHLVTSSESIENAQWDISLTMDFNPSSSNRTYIYLVSDATDLEGDLNGYFVMVGHSNDEVSLYRQDGSSTTKIIDGIDDLLDIDSVSISIRVTRNADGIWELMRDLDSSGEYVSEGIVTDNVYVSSTYFGIRCDYSPTRHDLFWFDDLTVTGTGVVDDVAPIVTGLTVIDANTLEVAFNEALDLVSAENLSNYTWLPFESPIAAVLSGLSVTLTFSSEFPENEVQSLQVESVADIAGNPVVSIIEDFTNYVLGVGGLGDIVINEIMADPSPSVGLPDAEFIELFNASDSAFDLLGWNLQDTGTDEILESFILAPGAYVIVCDDDDADTLSNFGDVLPVSSLSALTNGGDSIALINPSGLSVDVVTYDISWYGGGLFDDGGYTLERKNPFLPCGNTASNWTASTDQSGGTPGTENSLYVETDDAAPFILGFSVLDEETLLLEFSEGMDELSLILGQYLLTPNASVVAQTPDALDELGLTISPALIPGEFYSLEISGPNDCSGNVLPDTTITFFVPEEPDVGDVIINEIMADPSEAFILPEVEYVELFNNSDKIFELEGWNFLNGNSDNILGSHVLHPGAYVILCDEEDVGLLSSYGDIIGVESFSSLGNSSDDISLIDLGGEVLDAVAYTIEWYQSDIKDDGGYSLELINPELPCSGEANWIGSKAHERGTPGSINSVYDLSPDVQAPFVCTATPTETGQQVELVFSEPLEAESIDPTDFIFEPELAVLGVVSNRERVLLIMDGPLDEGVIYSISISGITDCSVNFISSSSQVLTGIPLVIEEGDLLINEVLFNPRTGGVDFVELYNNSEKTLSLKDWKMANRENGDVRNILVITSEDLLIFPGEFLALTEDKANLIFNYPIGIAKRYYEVGGLPSYADDEGYVLLLSPNEGVYEEFYYNDDYQFALIDILDGVSLERIDYNRLTNDPTNWHSAVERVGWATPGYENSQRQPANASSASFTLEPDVFSPDGDGHQDVLNISYALDKPGSVANISIFDRDGRLMRLLVRNELLANKGTISWDGITDDGSKARIGVYIVLIELFDLEGNTSSTKKSCVLGGRL